MHSELKSNQLTTEFNPDLDYSHFISFNRGNGYLWQDTRQKVNREEILHRQIGNTTWSMRHFSAENSEVPALHSVHVRRCAGCSMAPCVNVPYRPITPVNHIFWENCRYIFWKNCRYTICVKHDVQKCRKPVVRQCIYSFPNKML